MEIFERLEPNIKKGLQEEYTLLSIAISLKRIADQLENIPHAIQQSIQEAIWNATRK